MRLPLLLGGSALVLVAALTGCRVPEAELPPPATPAPGGGGPSPVDPRLDVLAEEVAVLRSTVELAHAALAEAAEAGDVASAHAAAGRAVRLLTADPRLADRGEEPAAPPLLPGPADLLAQDAAYDDVLSRALTAARGSGPAGGAILDVLRDPIAGDLGVWQRDARSQLDAARDAAAARTLEDAEAAVVELVGEGTRALAWSLLARRTQDLGLAREYAGRGAAHLDVILAALDGLDAG